MTDLSTFPPRRTPPPAPINAVAVAELVRRGLQLADAYCVSDIETSAAPVGVASARWYDVRPMLDDREHSPAVIDMAAQALAYATQRGLIEFHATEPHLVRITPQGMAS
jgi:hypothetical protein